MARQQVAALVDPLRKLLSRGATGHAANMLRKLHAADVARLFDYLRVEQQGTAFDLILTESAERGANLICELDVPVAVGLLEGLPDAQVASVIAELDSDDAAEIIPAMPEEQAERVLNIMKDSASEPIEGLLSHEEETAGRIMSPEVFALEEQVPVAETIAALRTSRSEDLEMVFYLYVVDDRRHLVGVCSLRELLLADPTAQLSTIMSPSVTSVNTATDQEDVARLVARYDLLALPVVDDENKLVGIITVDDVIDIIRDEETEDMLLMAGLGEGDEEEVLRAPVWKNALQRFPWLLAAFGGGIAAWQIYEYFAGRPLGAGEGAAADVPLIIILAGFMPIIAGMGGNSGTQSATIVVRGLATGRIHGRQDFRVVLREVAVAMMMGVTFGVLLALVAGAIDGERIDPVMRGVLGLAIAVSMTTAALVGAAVPMLIRRLGFDPAIATGPVVTTAIDVVGVAAYFSIAASLL
jgi:magnesium transporter